MWDALWTIPAGSPRRLSGGRTPPGEATAGRSHLHLRPVPITTECRSSWGVREVRSVTFSASRPIGTAFAGAAPEAKLTHDATSPDLPGPGS